MLSAKKNQYSHSHKFYMFTALVAVIYVVLALVTAGFRTKTISDGEHPDDSMSDFDDVKIYIYCQTFSDLFYRLTIVFLLISIYLCMSK